MRFLLTPAGFFSPKKGWQKLEADIPAKFGMDSLLHMFYKLLNGNFSISSIQLLASKVIETEKDEGNWGAPLAQKGKEKLLGTHGWQKLNSSLFILCINTKRENTLHLVKREKRVLKQNYILPLSPYPPPKIHTLSHTLNSDNATTHVGWSKECAASIPESCKKTFLWTNSLKHMFQDFKLNSEPEMSGRTGKAGLVPSWLCCYNPGFSP